MLIIVYYSAVEERCMQKVMPLNADLETKAIQQSLLTMLTTVLLFPASSVFIVLQVVDYHGYPR